MKTNTLLRTATLGYAVGIRSMTPLAALSWGAGSGEISLRGTRFQFMADPKVSLGLAVAAAGEMVADKLPFTPPRTQPFPLAVRMLNGALAGAIVFETEDEPVAVGAVIGAAAAAAGSFGGYGLRMLLERGMPGPIAGVAGDIQAVSLSMAGVTGEVGVPML